MSRQAETNGTIAKEIRTLILKNLSFYIYKIIKFIRFLKEYFYSCKYLQGKSFSRKQSDKIGFIIILEDIGYNKKTLIVEQSNILGNINAN